MISGVFGTEASDIPKEKRKPNAEYKWQVTNKIYTADER
jgi:hypothetical protein